jgi:hypothetical protein
MIERDVPASSAPLMRAGSAADGAQVIQRETALEALFEESVLLPPSAHHGPRDAPSRHRARQGRTAASAMRLSTHGRKSLMKRYCEKLGGLLEVRRSMSGMPIAEKNPVSSKASGTRTAKSRCFEVQTQRGKMRSPKFLRHAWRCSRSISA